MLKLAVGFVRAKRKHGDVDVSVKNLKPHYVPVMNYGNGKFVVADPVVGRIVVEENILREAFDLISSKCNRDKRMICFKTPE